MGSLLVVGGGDPNISGRFYEDDSFAIFDRWAEGLQQAGIVRVTGDLILNASSFDGIYRHPDWPPERDTRWYQAPDLRALVQRQRRHRVGRHGRAARARRRT